MCGIIGYTGQENAVPKITKGLSVLEYRGYDSVGIAAETEDGVKAVKCRGRIGALEEKLENAPIENCHCAIGHTRWATHGGPSDVNAHPHRAGRVVLVHNGIIENYKILKEKLQKAVADEEYEQAAKLRDTIRALSIQLERKESDIKVKPHDRLETNGEEGANDTV